MDKVLSMSAAGRPLTLQLDDSPDRHPVPQPRNGAGPALWKRRQGAPAMLELNVPDSPSETAPIPLDEALHEDLGRIRIEGLVYPCAKADFEDPKIELGRGTFGIVRKLKHKPTGVDLAVKQMRGSMKPEVRRQLMREITLAKDAINPYIVTFYGLDFVEGHVLIYMEIMQASLDKVYQRARDCSVKIPEPVLGKMTVAIVKGLAYLKSKLRVMHRDVKPSNVLMGFDGSIKLCDMGITGCFGEKSELQSAVGCDMYLSPERLDPQTSSQPYDVRSDVWSLGITLVELARQQYPYEAKTVFALLNQVVHGPAPTIPEEHYSRNMASFVALCLQKKKEFRPKYSASPEKNPAEPSLLEHPFVKEHEHSEEDIAAWYQSFQGGL